MLLSVSVQASFCLMQKPRGVHVAVFEGSSACGLLNPPHCSRSGVELPCSILINRKSCFSLRRFTVLGRRRCCNSVGIGCATIVDRCRRLRHCRLYKLHRYGSLVVGLGGSHNDVVTKSPLSVGVQPDGWGNLPSARSPVQQRPQAFFQRPARICLSGSESALLRVSGVSCFVLIVATVVARCSLHHEN